VTATPSSPPPRDAFELVDAIRLALSNGHAPDSHEVTQLLAELRGIDPNGYEIARKLVTISTSQPSSPEDQKTSWLGTTTKLGGVGVAGYLLSYGQSLLGWIQSVDPIGRSGIVITNPISLLGIIALVGSISGFIYSIYINRKNRALTDVGYWIVLPTFKKSEDKLVLSQLGFLNEMLSGAFAALLTIGVSTLGLPLPKTSIHELTEPTQQQASPGQGTSPSLDNQNSGSNEKTITPETERKLNEFFGAAPTRTFVSQRPSNSAAPQETKPQLPSAAGDQVQTKEKPTKDDELTQPAKPIVNLLTYSVIFGSLVSGWYGARTRALSLGHKLLQTVLADTSVTPPLTQREADAIRTAPTAADAAAIASKKNEVIGAFVNVPADKSPTT
jgi:hypothetical protein